MSIFEVFILAFVEGLTEFIPVSSTGHMLLVKPLLGLTDESVNTFIIFIQLGAILGVAFLYRQKITELLTGLFMKDPQARKSILLNFDRLSYMHFVAACLPVLLSGLFFYSIIREVLFGVYPVAIGLIVGGIVMIVSEKIPRAYLTENVDQITLKQAFIIGLGQCFALWPGVSRSGSTMVTGLFLGIKHKPCADFSFLIAIPIMALAVSYELYKSWENLSFEHLWPFSLGFILSFIFSLLSVKWFLNVLPRLKLIPFGYYRIFVGFVSLALIYIYS